MVGYEKYPCFIINNFKIWILLKQIIHEILSINMINSFFGTDMDGLYGYQITIEIYPSMHQRNISIICDFVLIFHIPTCK